MTLEVIICTYNRPDRVSNLVKQLQQCSPLPHRILVVDSSEEENGKLKEEKLVTYIHSNHKNQPYQRFVGWHFSEADLLVYLDDDMEMVNMNVVAVITQHFTNHRKDVAMALRFEDKNPATSLSSVPQSRLLKKGSKLKNLWNILSGQPEYAPGQMGWCGLRGKQPPEGGYTQWLSGGAFAAKRRVMYQNFNFQLFDLFEKKWGMGEDAMLGYTLFKQGNVYYNPELLFVHNDDNKSHYATDMVTYAHRVMYSRWYLSREKARLDSSSLILARLHFMWYGVCRLIGYLTNALVHPGRKRFQILRGSALGYFRTWNMKNINLEKSKQYWQTELKKLKA